MNEANGHLEVVVQREVERQLEQRVGAVDVAVNQRCGPIEKHQVDILTALKDLKHEVGGLRQDQVNLAGELRKDRLSRERRRKRRTQ